MKVIKRNGAEVEFDIVKIIAAVTKANAAAEEDARMTPVQIQRIAESVELACQGHGPRPPRSRRSRILSSIRSWRTARLRSPSDYITYRYTRSLVRKSNTTDDRILTLIECNNEEVKQENANKNPDRQLRPARLHGGRGQPRPDQPHPPARRTSSRRTRRASSTSTTRTTMPSICTTATS